MQGMAEVDEMVVAGFMQVRKQAIDQQNEAAKARERTRKRKSSEVAADDAARTSAFDDVERVVYRSHTEATDAAPSAVAQTKAENPCPAALASHPCTPHSGSSTCPAGHATRHG